MSPPPRPSLAAGIAAVFRLETRRVVRGRKLRLAGATVALVLAAVVGSRYAVSADPVEAVHEALDWGFFTLLVFLLPFLFTAGAIGEEVEERTFSFLSSRPVGRFAITAGKYLAGMAFAIGLLWSGLLLLHVAAYVTEPAAMVDELPTTLRAMGAIGLLGLFYGALCLFWGALIPEAAGIASTLQLVLLELCLTWVPSIFRLASMNYHARQLVGLPQRSLFPKDTGRFLAFNAEALLPPEVPPWVAVLVIASAALLTLLFSVLVVSASEYRFSSA